MFFHFNNLFHCSDKYAKVEILLDKAVARTNNVDYNHISIVFHPLKKDKRCHIV